MEGDGWGASLTAKLRHRLGKPARGHMDLLVSRGLWVLGKEARCEAIAEPKAIEIAYNGIVRPSVPFRYQNWIIANPFSDFGARSVGLASNLFLGPSAIAATLTKTRWQ